MAGALSVLLLCNLWETKEAQDSIMPKKQKRRGKEFNCTELETCHWQSKLWGWSRSLF